MSTRQFYFGSEVQHAELNTDPLLICALTPFSSEYAIKTAGEFQRQSCKFYFGLLLQLLCSRFSTVNSFQKKKT